MRVWRTRANCDSLRRAPDDSCGFFSSYILILFPFDSSCKKQIGAEISLFLHGLNLILVVGVTAGSNGTFLSMVDSKAWQGGGITSISSPPPSRASVLTCLPGPSPPMSVTSQTSTQPPAPATRRNVGGRRPNKNTGITPEEEERRRVRRERNKMAAARCRKRRMDHTNSLLQVNI